MTKSPRLSKLKRPEAVLLRAFALGYPEAYEDFPWGERVAKVKGKVFVFLGRDGNELGLSVKLPESGMLALGLPFASPTGYGLGKAGWVTVRFGKREKAPVALLRSWIDESYRAVAPKKLVAALSASASSKPGQVSATTGRTSAARKPRRTRRAR
jgi:predicted DNA-binding protein (MmcQ/YjbR family)